MPWKIVLVEAFSAAAQPLIGSISIFRSGWRADPWEDEDGLTFGGKPYLSMEEDHSL